ncbi:hypothetical protein ACFRJ9_00030 [Paenarthrobacter sp. NPDC056912]
MTWEFCNNDDCPDSWHWTDLAGVAEACRDTDTDRDETPRLAALMSC